MTRRLRYRFVGRFRHVYRWESVDTILPNDSRVDDVRCTVEHFWGGRANVPEALVRRMQLEDAVHQHGVVTGRLPFPAVPGLETSTSWGG